MKKRTIYLDHNATTPLHPEVKKTLREAMDEFGNPSSLHQFGRRAKRLMDDSRNRVASFLGARPEEIVFVGSGSEANNTVLSTIACGCPPRNPVQSFMSSMAMNSTLGLSLAASRELVCSSNATADTNQDRQRRQGK